MGQGRLTDVTSKNLKHLLQKILRQIEKNHEERHDLILNAWPKLIGVRLAPLTTATSFVDGVLTVKVRSSSLLSVLAQHERAKLLKQLREMFPSISIRNIRFHIG